MIGRTIAWCVSNRLLVYAGAIALSIAGAWAMLRTPIDALPDLSDVQVIVTTEWPGRSPDLIEDQITYPIITALLSTPRVRSVRGFTDFGISYVYVVFDDATDLYWARTRVLENLQSLRSTLPEGVSPAMAPDATGVGWVFEYALVDESGSHSLDELRSLQDWTIRYSLASVKGVAEVASIGGFVKQYQVTLDPVRMSAYGLSPRHVVDAIRASNNDAEGRLLEFAGREYMVRVKGYLTSVADIEKVSLGSDRQGTPLRVGDVARVQIGPDLRRGVAELDGRGEVVGGIVIMRWNENASGVIERVKEKLAQVQGTLPPGVTIVPTYDRSQLIAGSLGTLRRILLEEIVVVSLVVLVFLFHFRSVVIVLVVLPIAVLASFLPAWYFGVTANIMSLGGIALAMGVLVDAAIVIVENGHRRVLEEGRGAATRMATVIEAAHQVGRPVFFSLLVIIVSFLPVFMLESQEGRLFYPLALTKTFAMATATLLAITLVPVLMTSLLGAGRGAAVRANPVNRFCTSVYEPVLRAALRWKWTVLLVNAAVIPLVLPLIFVIGHEFMPPLFEGSILYMPTAPPGLSITDATRLLQQQDRVIRNFPEVQRVFGSAGRATTATDNSPMGMFNTIIDLKPRSAWRAGMTVERLQSEMDQALQVPGLPNVWTQPIRSRLDMLFTGIKTPVGIKILGADRDVIDQLAQRVEGILRGVPGTRSVYAERANQGYYVDIQIDRAAIGRYGLTIADVEDVIQTAIGGETISHTVEGRERYPISVRYERDFRDDLPAIERVLVQTPRGAQVPLGQLATVTLTTGPAMIRDEGGKLAGYVYVDTSTRDIGGYVANARDVLDRELKLPVGYTLDWAGQYEFQTRAARRISLLLPIVCVTIFILLYLTFRSASEALIVMLSVVYAMTGGVVLQWLLGYNFSVAVWVGYIALFGVAVQTGVVMVVYLHEALDRRLETRDVVTPEDISEATVSGAVLRLRPKLMTVATTVLGLLPILWSTGIGSDVMKPIAAPIVGGMLTSAVHVLIVTPIIFCLIKQRALAHATLRSSNAGRVDVISR